MNKKFVVFALMFVTVFVMQACSNDDKDPDFPIADVELGNYIGIIEDQVGTVNYNETIESWYIQCVVEGTIDEINAYYPVELKEEFKMQRQTVVFSGKVYEMKETLPAMGGLTNFRIQLSSIAHAK